MPFEWIPGSILPRPALGVGRAARGKAPWRERVARALHVVVGVMTLAGSAAPALANDLSDYPCTAGDVEIVGSGIVVNEPCICPPGGTFDAVVQFTVRNNTSSGRYCIAIHLVPDGVVLTEPLDIVMRDANGSSIAPGKSGGEPYHDTVMYATIPNFSCDIGSVCFGSAGVTSGKCEPGKCTTVSWNTSPGQANCTTADQSPPGGQCRHQQVCVTGYGASLACTSNCGTTCEGSATLQACVSGPADHAPYTLTVTGDDGSSQTQSTLGDDSGAVCLDFTVSPGLAPTTTYTLTVTDNQGCTRTATTSLDVRKIPVADAGADQALCSAGATTNFSLAGTATNGTGAWSVVSGPVTIADAGNLSSGATVTGIGTATLRLTVSNPPCPPTTDDVVLTVNAPTVANAGPDQTMCAAGATTPFILAGSVSGGTGAWSVVKGPVVIDNPNSLTSDVTFTGTGTATLRLTTTSNATPACLATTDDVVLTVNALPVAHAGADQVKCSAGATTGFTLAGSASGGTPTWSVVSGPVVISDPSSLTSGVTFTGTGTATLRLATTSNATPRCETAADDVVLNVIATVVQIMAPTSGCNGILLYKAYVDGAAGCDYVWTIDGQSLAAFAAGGGADDARVARTSGPNDRALEFRALDNTSHTISVSASCSTVAGTCTGTTSTTAQQCVSPVSTVPQAPREAGGSQ